MDKAKMRAWEQKQSDNLTDRYVKKALYGIGFEYEEMTPELIEMKRTQLMLYRKISTALLEAKKAREASKGWD